MMTQDFAVAVFGFKIDGTPAEQLTAPQEILEVLAAQAVPMTQTPHIAYIPTRLFQLRGIQETANLP